jgi:hypothetical protein
VLLAGARWIDPPTTAVQIERRITQQLVKNLFFQDTEVDSA